MKRLSLLATAAVFGLTLIGGTPSFARGGGHGHGGHHSGGHAHAAGGHHAAAHHAAAHASVPHHAAPRQASHAKHHVAGHRASNHAFAHNGHAWHHHHGWGHGWGNGYWGNGYWNNGVWTDSGNGLVASGVAAPWVYDQFWSVAPETPVLPESRAFVTRAYMANVLAPPAPACPLQASATQSNELP